MNLPFYIARRYLISKKSHNIINIISGISISGVTIGTMALIVVLSVFNGFEGLITSMFNSFNPDLIISPSNGKSFLTDPLKKAEIKNMDGLIYYTEVLEENVLLRYNNKQHIANIKGVSGDYLQMNKLQDNMIEGEAILQNNGMNFAIIGAGVSYFLDFYQNGSGKSISIYAPNRKEGYAINFDDAFNNQNIFVSGVFNVQQDFDTKYIITTIDFAKKLLGYENEITAIEIGLDQEADVDLIQEKISRLMGDDFQVKNRFEQQELLYRIMKSEKWAIFLILTFILIIATFNVIGSLSMLILDKKKDIRVLQSMGANTKLIKHIFLIEGSLISISGAILGLFLGGLICWLQLQFGLISLGDANGSFVVNAYPVDVQILDFIYVFFTVCIIGIAAAWIPARQISKKYLNVKLS